MRWFGKYLINIAQSEKKINISLKKAQSLISKIIKMHDKNEYCIDIMQQNLAAIGLLKSAHQMILECHLNSCFKKAMATNNSQRKQAMIEEILKVSKLANK